MKRAGLVAIVTAAAACGPAPNLLPVNDLNRPTDVAFMCFGAFPAGTGTDGGVPDGGAGMLQVSGRPMQACHPQDSYDPGATPATRTFAFMPNSAAGTLSAVDADHWKLIDLNLDTGGYGTAPLGQLPSQISASDDGCRLISANRGSCDLTLVDPSVLVADTLSRENGNMVTVPSPRTASVTFRPIKGDGTPLLASPYEAVFLPQDTSRLLTAPTTRFAADLADPESRLRRQSAAAVGWPAPPGQPGPKDWYALVTYPSCDLIAVVALSTQKIVSSAFVRRTTDGQGRRTVSPWSPPAPHRAVPSSTAPGRRCPPRPASPPTPRPARRRRDDRRASRRGRRLGRGACHGRSRRRAGTGGAPGTGGSAGGAPGTGGSAGGPRREAAPGRPAELREARPSAINSQPAPTSVPGRCSERNRHRARRLACLRLARQRIVHRVGRPLAEQPDAARERHCAERGRPRLEPDPFERRPESAQPRAAGSRGRVRRGRAEFHRRARASAPRRTSSGSMAHRKYLYAIARDGTLRVIQVPFRAPRPSARPTPIRCTCPRASRPCPPAFRSTRRYRRPFSVGPGIHFPSLPIDVAAVDLQRPPTTASRASTAPTPGCSPIRGSSIW